MTIKPKLTLIAALAAASIASPAFAQSLSRDGSLPPHYIDSHGVLNQRVAGSTRHLYMSAPGGVGASAADSDPNSPALAGGGSLGYNQNLYNY
jgi:hypothetical protein